MKYSKGLQSSELGSQITLGQWSFRLAFRQAWLILVVWAGLCPAGTRRCILRQQSPSRASPRCPGPLCTAWQRLAWTLCLRVKEVGGHDVALAWDDPQDHNGGWKFGVPFGQEWHQPLQNSGFGPKLSSNGKPATCALLETFPSPVLSFRRAKLFAQLYEFRTLLKHFCN
jgi:hypothetical protein